MRVGGTSVAAGLAHVPVLGSHRATRLRRYHWVTCYFVVMQNVMSDTRIVERSALVQPMAACASHRCAGLRELRWLDEGTTESVSNHTREENSGSCGTMHSLHCSGKWGGKKPALGRIVTRSQSLSNQSILRSCTKTDSVSPRYDIKGSWVNRSADPPVPGSTASCRHCNQRFTLLETKRQREACPSPFAGGSHEVRFPAAPCAPARASVPSLPRLAGARFGATI